ncbi:MAG: hypothetical protein ACXVMS_00135 [Flavisolibacter sp.]
MTRFEFQLLSEAEKLESLYQEGTYIGKRRILDSSSILYQLDGFYVEVLYQKYRCQIRQIRCSENTILLDPYLEQIGLPVFN